MPTAAPKATANRPISPLPQLHSLLYIEPPGRDGHFAGLQRAIVPSAFDDEFLPRRATICYSVTVLRHQDQHIICSFARRQKLALVQSNGNGGW